MARSGNKKSRTCFFMPKKKKNCASDPKGGQNVEKENSFSQNDIWNANDNFNWASKDEITFASYFRRSEDL